MVSSMPSEQQIAEAMEKVLSRREFWGSAPRPVRVVDWQALFAGMKTLSGFGFFLMFLIAAALIFLLVWLVYSKRRYHVANYGKLRSAELSVADDPWLYAEALALKQDFSGALLALYALHLQMLQRQGWIEWDASKTGLQYQWELKGRGYDDVAGFEAFRKVFNRARYGGYSELKETYDTFLAYCRKGLKRRQTA